MDNIDAFPLATTLDNDWINDPDGYGLTSDEMEHVTGTSSGLSLDASTDIPTPYGIDVAKGVGPDSPDVEVPLDKVGYEHVAQALMRLMARNDRAVRTTEILPPRLSVSVFSWPIATGNAPLNILGSDNYRRRALLCFTSTVPAEVPLVAADASSAQSGQGFPIPLRTATALELRSTDEIWITPPATTTAVLTVYVLTERDSEPLS